MSEAIREPIGFDFGTSTTLIASPRGIVGIGEPYAWMPSVVGLDDEGAVLVGESALDLPSEQVIHSIKRSITEGRLFVRIDTPTGIRDVRADDLIVALLREAATRGKDRDQDVSQPGTVQIGCPAMWTGAQRRRLLQAAGEAGISVTLADLVDEPVAAGIAWLASHTPADPGPMRVLVFDMGGGTLDIAVLDVRGLHHLDVSVLAALGIAEAGDLLDEAIAEDLEYVLAASGMDIDALPNAAQVRNRLPRIARNSKVRLTLDDEIEVKVDRRVPAVLYSRSRLNEVFSRQMERAEMYVYEALKAARRTQVVPGTVADARTPLSELVQSVDVVVLSGGMSQIPYVAQRLRALFPARTSIEMACEASENAVALGLARTGRYGRINMLRPGFDVYLEWDDALDGHDSRTVYEAFTPLVESWQIAQGRADLRYTRNGLDLTLPRSGKGRIRVKAHSGGRVRATLGGSHLDGFPVSLSEQKFEFSIYPNGRIRMTDGGGTYEGRIDDWHAIEAPYPAY